MAATKSSGVDTVIQLGRNEEALINLQHQHHFANLLAANVRASESGLKHLQNGSTPRHEAEKILLPDMFVSFVSQKPKLNVFDFDDQFDEGELRTNLEAARKEVEAMIELQKVLMKSPNAVLYSAAYHPLRYVYQTVCQRIFKRSSPGNQRRYIKAMEDYFYSLISQVDLSSSAKQPDIETHITLRSESIGVKLCLAFTEFVHALDIPDEIFEHPSIRKIEILAAELVLLHNDTLSFHKEHAIGATQNIIHLFRQEGLSQQQAYDQVDILMRKRYHEWYMAHAEIPWWGEEVDAQVMLYLEGCQNQVLGNLNWSFNSERYFGTETAAVRKTRAASVLF